MFIRPKKPRGTASPIPGLGVGIVVRGRDLRNTTAADGRISSGVRSPIDDALPALTDALRTHEAAVLVAPPGAGKTTRVPLVLKDEPWAAERQDHRAANRGALAARRPAERMAKTLGETVGETVGLRVRFGSKVSKATRIEVVYRGYLHRA